MLQKAKIIIAALLAVILIGTGFSGCAVSPASGSGDPTVNPFDTTRVAEVRIVRKRSGFDWAAFTGEINQLAGPAKVELFIG